MDEEVDAAADMVFGWGRQKGNHYLCVCWRRIIISNFSIKKTKRDE
jgi:hypothetical protein